MFYEIYYLWWDVCPSLLTHWGRVTHICVGKLTQIGSDNGLSPGRRQAIIWTNAGILLIRPLGTNFSERLIVKHTFSFNKIHLKLSSAKWRPFYLGLNVFSVILCEQTKASTHQPPQEEENKIGCKIRLNLPLIGYHGIHGTQYFVVHKCGKPYAIQDIRICVMIFVCHTLLWFVNRPFYLYLLGSLHWHWWNPTIVPGQRRNPTEWGQMDCIYLQELII